MGHGKERDIGVFLLEIYKQKSLKFFIKCAKYKPHLPTGTTYTWYSPLLREQVYLYPTYSRTRALVHKLTQLILVAIGAGTEGPIAGWLSKHLDLGWGEGSSPAEVSALVLWLCPPSPSALQSWAPHCHLWGGGHPRVCQAEPGGRQGAAGSGET